MSTLLIGGTGFLGKILNSTRSFDLTVGSKDIANIRGKHFTEVYCAAPSSLKWKANRFPEEDLASIEALINELKTITADSFIHFSTLDAFIRSENIDEDEWESEPEMLYGKHRWLLEKTIEEHFSNSLIVRLPNLFGTGLKKNAIFDMMNNRLLETLHPRTTLQWYSADRILSDVKNFQERKLNRVFLATEPLTHEAIRDEFFPKLEIGAEASSFVTYDIHSKFADDHYFYSATQVLDDIREFLNR